MKTRTFWALEKIREKYLCIATQFETRKKAERFCSAGFHVVRVTVSAAKKGRRNAKRKK